LLKTRWNGTWAGAGRKKKDIQANTYTETKHDGEKKMADPPISSRKRVKRGGDLWALQPNGGSGSKKMTFRNNQPWPETKD